jgi:hypothetical protein
MMSRDEIHSEFARRFSVDSLTIPVAPVTDNDLHQVEEELKTTFPSAYLEFMIHYGPIWTPNISNLNITDRFDLELFIKPRDIAATIEDWLAGGEHDWLIPIAGDGGGNLFGFKREAHHSRPDDCPVLLYDHDYDTIHQEADSFDHWLEFFVQLANNNSG